MKVAVILGSNRPERQSLKFAKWVVNSAQLVDDFEVELVDIADYPMPIFDEPISPRYNPNRQPSTSVQKWLDKVGSFDSYIFVTPEYNHSIPAVLKNALDYLTVELLHKPSSIASHGSVGGARAAMHLREILAESKTVVIPNAVAVAGASNIIDDKGNLDETVKANPYGPQAALESMLTELKWYTEALNNAR